MLDLAHTRPRLDLSAGSRRGPRRALLAGGQVSPATDRLDKGDAMAFVHRARTTATPPKSCASSARLGSG